MRRRLPLGAALAFAAFALLGWALARDLWRWRAGQGHLSAATDVLLIVVAAGALALASTLFLRFWVRMLGAGR